MKPFLVVGAGFSGAVLARELASLGGRRVLVLDSRPHLGGNCHTARDEATGVMVHQYGPHIFHSPSKEVWDYLDRYAELQPYTHRVKATIPRGVFGLPINLHTINQFLGTSFSPVEAAKFLAEQRDRTITEPANFEEQALQMLGRELYEAFFYGYTKKQWGCEPRELPASILKRLPVRFDYGDSYYHDPWQGIPRLGYSEAIRRILTCPGVELKLSTAWDPAMQAEFAHIFFTGALDEFFGCDWGRLRYRTVTWERLDAEGDLQGTAQMNYPGMEVPHTRICEHKHFAPWETHARTCAFREFSRATAPGETGFYPLRLPADLQLFQRYAARAVATPGVAFLGRLATYRYLNMHHVIGEACHFAPRWFAAYQARAELPVFPPGVLL